MVTAYLEGGGLDAALIGPDGVTHRFLTGLLCLWVSTIVFNQVHVLIKKIIQSFLAQETLRT